MVASCLADQRPELVDRMILMGVMQKTRKSWRMLLEESLHLMKEQRMDEFGQAVHFVSGQSCTFNRKPGCHRQQSGCSLSRCPSLLRLSRTAMISTVTVFTTDQCTDSSAKCWWLVGNMTSFTLPHENANFALQCPNMQYVQIAVCRSCASVTAP